MPRKCMLHDASCPQIGDKNKRTCNTTPVPSQLSLCPLTWYYFCSLGYHLESIESRLPWSDATVSVCQAPQPSRTVYLLPVPCSLPRWCRLVVPCIRPSAAAALVHLRSPSAVFAMPHTRPPDVAGPPRCPPASCHAPLWSDRRAPGCRCQRSSWPPGVG